jgi:bifunctional non-homologous end joining protein LigD
MGTERFPLIFEALSALKVTTCLIDGEAVACTETGLAEFEFLRARRGDVHLCAFDLLELDGRDLRLEHFAKRRRLLAPLVRKPRSGLVLNAVFEQEGPLVFEHACLLGCEGIVSKRKHSRYRSGRSRDWLKVKNPNAPAVKPRRRRRLGQKEMAMTGKKPDHDLRAEGDGSYVVEFRTAAGEVLAISIPAPSAR